MTAPSLMATSSTASGSARPTADGLYIKFHGRGGHGAVPQTTIDPVMMAARFIVDVQSVISREKDPTEFGVVTIGAIHAGTAGNIIPDDAQLLGTIRTFKPRGARQIACRDRTHGEGRCRDVGRARARYQDRSRAPRRSSTIPTWSRPPQKC